MIVVAGRQRMIHPKCHAEFVVVRTVAFDLRGYGLSDKPSAISEYTLDKLAEDINQLISELGW